MHNVFACLVHEAPDCVRDLVANLLCLDPGSSVLLYDGGPDSALLEPRSFADNRVRLVPGSRPIEWGYLHEFAFACMRDACENGPFETLTIVDSDQLLLRQGWSAALEAAVAARPNAGLLGSEPYRHSATSWAEPVRNAWAEAELWAPVLATLPRGEVAYARYTFWPATVFTERAVVALLELLSRADMQAALERSRFWATEEVLLPTLVHALGFDVVASPTSYEFVKFNVSYRRAAIVDALQRHDAYWAHPIPRSYDNPIRSLVRERYGGYTAP